MINCCSKCGKMLPNQPFWMVIPPGEEYKYFCSCNDPWWLKQGLPKPKPGKSAWHPDTLDDIIIGPTCGAHTIVTM